MSSEVNRQYFEPADFRMIREVLRRAGYLLSDTPENRLAHLSAAKLLVKEYQAGRNDPTVLLERLTELKLLLIANPHPPELSCWENEGGDSINIISKHNRHIRYRTSAFAKRTPTAEPTAS